MFKGGFSQGQKNHRGPHQPESNKTPAKTRSPITRSPIKTRRECSPYSKSPIRKQSKQMLSPAYNPPYVKINYINYKSPAKQRTPMKELKDRYTTNTQQAYKFRQQPKYSPYKIMKEGNPTLQRKDSGKCIENRQFKLKNYQLFSKLAKESGGKQNNSHTDSQKKHPLLTRVQDVKFISVNYFNSDPHLTKLHKYKKENVPNIHHFNDMQKPVEKQIQKQLSDQTVQKSKPVVQESQANFDRVLMSFANDFEDPYHTQLNMDPFL